MADNFIPFDKIKALYSRNVREKGVHSTAVGWNTTHSQTLRFDKLTSVIEDHSASVSVNDYGCGYGAHLAYLSKECGIQVSDYFGYDISEDMLSAARTDLSWFSGNLSLLCSSDISTVADYTFVSGSFNVRFEADDSVWQNFLEQKFADTFPVVF